MKLQGGLPVLPVMTLLTSMVSAKVYNECGVQTCADTHPSQCENPFQPPDHEDRDAVCMSPACAGISLSEALLDFTGDIEHMEIGPMNNNMIDSFTNGFLNFHEKDFVNCANCCEAGVSASIMNWVGPASHVSLPAESWIRFIDNSNDCEELDLYLHGRIQGSFETKVYSSLVLSHNRAFCIVRYNWDGTSPPADGTTVTVSIGQDQSVSISDKKLSQSLKDQGPNQPMDLILTATPVANPCRCRENLGGCMNDGDDDYFCFVDDGCGTIKDIEDGVRWRKCAGPNDELDSPLLTKPAEAPVTTTTLPTGAVTTTTTTHEVAIHLSCSKPVAKGYCAYFIGSNSAGSTGTSKGNGGGSTTILCPDDVDDSIDSVDSSDEDVERIIDFNSPAIEFKGGASVLYYDHFESVAIFECVSSGPPWTNCPTDRTTFFASTFDDCECRCNPREQEHHPSPAPHNNHTPAPQHGNPSPAPHATAAPHNWHPTPAPQHNWQPTAAPQHNWHPTPAPQHHYVPTPHPTYPHYECKPPSVVVSGMCESQHGFNGQYDAIAKTASGRYYYQMYGYELFIYWDPACDGINQYNEWIFDVDRPSTTAYSDLDGDGDCDYGGFIESLNETPPSNTNVWNIGCVGMFTPTDITIVEIPNPHNPPHCSPTPAPVAPITPSPTEIGGGTDSPTPFPTKSPTPAPSPAPEVTCPVQSVVTTVVFTIPCTENNFLNTLAPDFVLADWTVFPVRRLQDGFVWETFSTSEDFSLNEDGLLLRSDFDSPLLSTYLPGLNSESKNDASVDVYLPASGSFRLNDMNCSPAEVVADAIFGSCSEQGNREVFYSCVQMIDTLPLKVTTITECPDDLSNYEFDVRLCSTNEFSDVKYQCELKEEDQFCWSVEVGRPCFADFGDEEIELSPSSFSRAEWESAGFTCVDDFCSSDGPKRVNSEKGLQAYNTQCLTKSRRYDSVNDKGGCSLNACMNFGYNPRKCSNADIAVMNNAGFECSASSGFCGAQGLDMEEVVEMIYDEVSDTCAESIDERGSDMRFEACQRGRTSSCRLNPDTKICGDFNSQQTQCDVTKMSGERGACFPPAGSLGCDSSVDSMIYVRGGNDRGSLTLNADEVIRAPFTAFNELAMVTGDDNFFGTCCDGECRNNIPEVCQNNITGGTCMFNNDTGRRLEQVEKVRGELRELGSNDLAKIQGAHLSLLASL